MYLNKGYKFLNEAKRIILLILIRIIKGGKDDRHIFVSFLTSAKGVNRKNALMCICMGMGVF